MAFSQALPNLQWTFLLTLSTCVPQYMCQRFELCALMLAWHVSTCESVLILRFEACVENKEILIACVIDTPPQSCCRQQFCCATESDLGSQVVSLPPMSTSPNCLTNPSCFCRGNALVNPSADMSFVATHLMCMSPFWTCSHSQCWLMSTCRSLVVRTGVWAVNKRIVCRLSFLMYSLCPVLKCNFRKRFSHQIACFPACSIASSSASVVEVVTVVCLRDAQSTGPL